MCGSWKLKHERQKSTSPPFHAWHAWVQTYIDISCWGVLLQGERFGFELGQSVGKSDRKFP